jgi:hypothetical protein
LKREQLQRKALGALRHLAQALEKDGDISAAIPFAWRQVELEPWSEESHRYLMRLLALRGRRAAALAQYEACQRALAEELNVEPSTETTLLYEQIRDGVIAPPPQPETQQPEPPLPVQPPGIQAETPPETLPLAPEAAPPETSVATPRWSKSAGMRLLAVLLIIAVLVAVISLSSRQPIPEPTSAPAAGKIVMHCVDLAVPRICSLDPQTGQLTPISDELPLDRIGPGMSWSPDGKQIVFSAAAKPAQETSNDLDLYRINADGTNLQPVTTGNANDIVPTWSPDAEWIAFHRDCNLWIVHPDGTQAEPLSFGLCVTGMAWSPDSRWIAFIDNDVKAERQRPSTIRVFPQKGGDSRVVYTFDRPVEGGRLAWSPDGQQILCVYQANGKENTLSIDADGQGQVEENIVAPLNWFPDFWPQWGNGK